MKRPDGCVLILQTVEGQHLPICISIMKVIWIPHMYSHWIKRERGRSIRYKPDIEKNSLTMLEKHARLYA